jgi:multiple sugar transport system permease protein
MDDSFGMFFDLMAYQTIFNDPIFRQSILNTLILVFVSVPISTVLALLIAVGLNSIKPLQKIFQTVFFMPYVTNTLAIGMVFSVMFSHPLTQGIMPEGLINTLFQTSIDWVGVTATRQHWMLVVLLYTTWSALPFKILVFIGGLQNISKQYYDAAKIDATPPKRILTRITIPLLSPLISYILITSFIGAFKAYESVLAVAGTTGRTLDRERWTAVAYVYDKIGLAGLDSNYVSYYSRGAAAAVMLFIIIMIFTAINLYVSKKKVHY